MTTSRENILQLKQQAPAVLPSMLMCDFAHLQSEVEQLAAAGARALHLDVMDANFVPNFTYGIPLVAAFRKLTDLPLDVHLMMYHPEKYLRQFQEAGADQLTVHVEACSPESLPQTLAEIRSLGMAAGIALNPATPLEQIEPYSSQADTILVMSVPAGFGGQKFDEKSLQKVEELRSRGGDWLIEMDGGINSQTIVRCAAAGADLLVAGSAIFQANGYAEAITELTRLADGGEG